MLRTIALLAILLPAAVCAQTQDHQHAGHGSIMPDPSRLPHNPSAALPVQPGQAAFAAIQEIVALLEADPHTDWSRVDIEALRQHLIDMNNVTLAAQVTRTPLEDGMRFAVTGAAPIQASIRRMVAGHVATMNNVSGWRFASEEIDGGASLNVRVPKADIDKLKALGFIGVLTRGMHHQAHHLMIARGGHPHH